MAVFYPFCRAKLSIVFDGFGGGESAPTIIPVRVASAAVHINGYHDADTYELEFNGNQLPLSPEMIKSGAVWIWMGQSDSLDVALSDANETDDNLMITGLVDDADYHCGDAGRVVRFTGKDYTSLLAGKAWDSTRRIPVGDDLVKIVQDLVDECTHAAEHRGQTLTAIYVEADGTRRSSAGIVRSASKHVTESTVTIKKSKPVKKSKTKKAGFPVPSGRNYWDVIYSLCMSQGLICYVRGLELVVAQPHVLEDVEAQQAARVAYGRNLKEVGISRHMTKEAVPQIVATAYDSSTGKTVTAKWPPDKDRQSSAALGKAGKHAALKITGVGTLREELKRVTPPAGITDEDTLRDYCRAYYEAVARSEAKLTFATKALKDLKGADLLKLRAGGPVRIEFDAYDDEDMQQLSAAQRYQRLLALGYAPQVADLIASEYDKLKHYRVPFYARDISFAWSKDEGISIQGDAVNYVMPSRDEGAA